MIKSPYMRIGIDISQAVYQTGVSDYTLDLVHALADKLSPDSLNLIGFSLRRRQELSQLFPASRVFPLPPTAMDLLWNRLHWGDVTQFSGPVDVFHASDWTQPPSRVPIVSTVHDLSPLLFPEALNSGRLRNIAAVHNRRLNWVARECSQVICVSAATASDFSRLFPQAASKVTVIPEALPSRFDVSVSPTQISAARLQFKTGDNYLVSIGTPSPRKNIPRLVSSFLKYRRQLHLPDKLVIIGGHGWGQLDLPSDPAIIYTGYISDQHLVSLLSGSRALVFPSLYEGFGLPILLGFRHQIPVITSQTSSLPEVAGDAAVLVDPQDERSMALGIAAALDQASRLVRLGHLRLTKFSWKKSAAQTLKLYSSLC